jgi:transcriptional regulator of met regulon
MAKRARKPFKLRDDRAANRQRPPAQQTPRRKLAIVDAKRLAQTIQGVELATNPALLESARKHAATKQPPPKTDPSPPASQTDDQTTKE